jgi:hypothetical protein
MAAGGYANEFKASGGGKTNVDQPWLAEFKMALSTSSSQVMLWGKRIDGLNQAATVVQVKYMEYTSDSTYIVANVYENYCPSSTSSPREI